MYDFKSSLIMNSPILWHGRPLGAGTKIEFLTDQGETLRNEYLLGKNFQNWFRIFCHTNGL